MPSSSLQKPRMTTPTMSMPENLQEGLRAELQSVLRSELKELKKQLDEVTRSQTHLSLKMDKIDGRLSGAWLNEGRPRTADVRDPSVAFFESPQDKFLEYISQEGMPDVRMPGDKIHQEGLDEPQLVRPSLGADIGKDDIKKKRMSTFSDFGTPGVAAALLRFRQEKSKQELMHLMAVNDEHKKGESESRRKWEKASWLKRLKMIERSTIVMLVDFSDFVIIALNAIFIGFSAENWKGEIDAWSYADLLFSCLFFLVFLTKIHLHGCALISSHRYSEIFDLILIILDFTQLLLAFTWTSMAKNLEDAGVPSASLFRIVRLLRVSRIIRLLTHPSFKSLLQMIEALILGMTTLVWAMLLFSIIVYVMALLCNAAFGEAREYEDVHPYFETVPRSMFTIFRCSFGDCSTRKGTPIQEFVEEHYGPLWSFVFSAFVFFVTIGLFNVISAIFVNTTLEHQKEKKARKLQDRFSDETLWATRVCTIISRCLIWDKSREMTPEQEAMLQSHEEQIDISLVQEDLPVEIVDEVCRNDALAKEALKDLDIEEDEHEQLSDMLDPDHSGQIAFSELINGLQRLRGRPRRSDIATINLMLRSAQEKLDEILSSIKDNAKRLKMHEISVSDQLSQHLRRWELPFPGKELLVHPPRATNVGSPRSLRLRNTGF